MINYSIMIMGTKPGTKKADAIEVIRNEETIQGLE